MTNNTERKELVKKLRWRLASLPDDCIEAYIFGRCIAALTAQPQQEPVASTSCKICGCVAPHSHNPPDENGHYHWVAVDLDGTLAEGAKHIDPLVVGEPRPDVVGSVKDWLRDGVEVRIFTARTSLGKDDRDVYAVTVAIQDWCEKHIGHRLPVTNLKQHGIIELWDDRAVNPVRANKEVNGLLTLLVKEKRRNEALTAQPQGEPSIWVRGYSIGFERPPNQHLHEWTPYYTAPQPGVREDELLKALRFYANGDHFNLSDENAWDTVSGEPQNFYCDEAGTATVEDGTIAKMALRGEQKGYVVLSADERAKGFVRPVRQRYVHKKCGVETHMGLVLAETYARNPEFYDETFCVSCKGHFPLDEFVWSDTDERVGS